MAEPIGQYDVVVVGGINSDYVIRGPELPRPGTSLDGDIFLTSPGGKGANAAAAAARVGARTALIGCVGRDDRGRDHIERLASEGVDVVHIRVDARSPTGAAVIHVDRHGQKQILAALGANTRLDVDAVHAASDTIRSSRVLLMQLEVPVECVRAAALLGHGAGVRIVLDPAPQRVLSDDLLALVDVVRANAAEVSALTGVHVHDTTSARDAARTLLRRGIQALVVEAEKGNLLISQSEEQWFPELPVQRVDATGAGDAFSAALAVALAEGQPLAAAGRFASGAAALSTTALGAQAGLPRRTELEAYLERVSG